MAVIRWLLAFALGGALSACASLTGVEEAGSSPAPAIVLKLDDFRADGGIHPGWEEVFRFLEAQDVTATIGVIGEGLEEPRQEAVDWLLARDARGHELWNHGYCHCRSGEGAAQVREFRGRSLAEQQAAIARTQYLGERVLGITFSTFGAPYNSTDANTARVLADRDDVRVWMYKDTSEEAAPSRKSPLPRIAAVNIEYPVHIPDFESFRAGYAAHRDEPVLVIQGHPRSWVDDPARMEEFRRIVMFLKAEGAQFVTPTEAVREREAATSADGPPAAREAGR
ncbi:polysaccharide deacetylase family protein [Citromicrobium bathyomarinum]|uniref:DUF2334 domain-containing protein n=1 Tax=Sphingomonadales TaxID=204457 RepID=UPI00315AFADC|tara:strand:+ start:15833 stop:16678 length:846 start_codon:yes stop_codon:yes gene_type:complete